LRNLWRYARRHPHPNQLGADHVRTSGLLLLEMLPGVQAEARGEEVKRCQSVQCGFTRSRLK
jgi:hypothetical protein